jgi:hypothetical protein
MNPRKGDTFDVTRPACAGMRRVNLDLDFGRPACGFGPDKWWRYEPVLDASSALYCNPPGDLRGVHVRNAIVWAATVHARWKMPVTVALFNEQVLFTSAAESAAYKPPGVEWGEKAMAGVFRRRVRWLDPVKGGERKNPENQGALLHFGDLRFAARVMRKAGLWTFPAQVFVPGERRLQCW